MEHEFQGARLRLARVLCGLTQTALAQQVNVTAAFISQAEAGHRNPGAELLSALGHVLGFRDRFFFAPIKPSNDLREDMVHFRKRASTAASLRARMLAHATLISEVLECLEEAVELPAYRVPEIRITCDQDVERAAERLRMEWGLGIDRPIDNVVRAAENHGVIVTKFVSNSLKVDAFCWHGRRGVIALTADKDNGARSRMDTSHELGHLVMHHGEQPGADGVETQANKFAGAFLMPRAGFAREFPRGRINFDVVLALKSRWKVSAAAIVRRAHELGLIDPVEYHRAYKFMNWKGWHKKEPVDITDEEPELVPLSFIDGEQDPAAVTDAMGWSDAIFEQILNVQVAASSRESSSSGLSEGRVLQFVSGRKPEVRGQD
jgi:Zn-dependent peptidase ImmA (M78 family)/DNA-binding XRE family transcriptional regulator